MQTKAQGAIEYLLIIGAAILVVALVIIALTSVTTTGTQSVGEDDAKNVLTPLEKLNTTELILNNYVSDSPTYLSENKINFTKKTNCTIDTALISMVEVLPDTEIYMGGNNNTYCGRKDEIIYKKGSIDCGQEIQINTDYNFQVYSTTTLSEQVTWTAWCD
jgi:hypothetical protein